jgi:hypothetical protein
MKKSVTLTDKVYRLKKEVAPLSYTIASRNSQRKPLYYFDGQQNRALRYAVNQKSPFEDEQDGNFIVEPIVFEDGFLRVPKTNPVLQEFLSLHPDNGKKFVEVNKEKDAQEELEFINYEVDALIAAKELGINVMENIGRVMLGLKVDKLSSSELKRDILLYARRNPKEFLDAIDDPMVKIQNMVARCFEASLLGMRNKGKDVYFNLKDNKSKLLTVPFGEDPVFIVASYLNTEEGIETYKLLESKLSE